MNIDIENVAIKKQLYWRPIYEDIENSYFVETKLFPTTSLNQCRNNPNERQKIPNEIKADLKNGYVTGVLFVGGTQIWTWV